MHRTLASPSLLRSLGLTVFVTASLVVACGEDAGSDGGAGSDGAPDDGSGSGGGTGSGGSGSGSGGGSSGLGGAPVIDPDDPIAPGTNEPLDPECNFAGAWLLRTTVTSVAQGDDQVARRWYYYEVAQDGERFQVSESLNCQVHVETVPWSGVTGARVTMSDGAITAVLDRTSHAGTQGTFKKDGDECAFTMAPVYEVRGVDPGPYLPDDPRDDEPLSALAPLPSDPEHEDVTDWDGAGRPGLQWEIDALLDGWRSSGQRDKQEFYSVPGDTDYAVPLDATEFSLKLDIELEEIVYAASNAIFETLGVPKADGHYVEVHRLGDDRQDAGLSADDLELCKALEAQYPF